jgi:Methyltransferase domain
VTGGAAARVPALEHAAGRPASGDRLAAVEAAVWVLGAAVATQREALTAPIEEVLAAASERTAVLCAAGLVREEGGRLVPVDELTAVGSAAVGRVQARLGALRQVLAAAAGESGWDSLDDEVLVNQGRASAVTGRLLATSVVRRLAGLPDALDTAGARILDVGTGVAALAVELALAFPLAEVVGIDILRRALDLAAPRVAEAGVAERLTLRRQDVLDLDGPEAYQFAWLPAPFLPEGTLAAAFPRLVTALRPGGWLIAGTNPAVEDPLRGAVGRWVAVRNGGNALDVEAVSTRLAAAGLADLTWFETVSGGPMLVAGRRG